MGKRYLEGVFTAGELMVRSGAQLSARLHDPNPAGHAGLGR